MKGPTRQIAKVLLIEDDPDDVLLLRQMLAEAEGARFDLEWADRLQAGLESLAAGGIDVLLLDLSLPDSQGLDTVLTVHAQGPGVPIVVLTGIDDEALAITAVREGAQDYLVKGQVDTNLLVRSIRYAIERKRAEQALRESEEKFRTLAEQSPNMIFIHKNGKVVYANKKCEGIMGYTREEFYADDFDFRCLMAPESVPLIEASLAKHMRGGEVQPYEYTLIAKGGTRIHAILNSTLINYEGKRAILGTITDITERKRAEEALRESKELFEKTFKSQRDGIFLLDAGSPPRILDSNPAATEIFGYNRRKMLGRTTAFLHVDEKALRKFQEELYPTIVERGFMHLPEFEMKRKNGSLFPTEHSVFPLEDQQGKCIGWVSVVRDITERKRAEEQLRKYANDLEKMVSERTAELANTTAFLNNILDSSTEYAIVATDLRGTILNWNTGARNIFGYDAREVVGKASVDIFYGDDFLHGKGEKNVLKAAIDAQEGNISSNNLRLMRKNGESFPADLSVTYLRDDRGKKIGIVGIIKDVTERKMLERKLMQSEKMAGIGTLATGIAHEVRNPLTIINNSTHLLREEIIGKTEEGEDLLRQIEGGIKRMQTIVNTLLDFSRPGGCELEFVDLRNLMEQILVLEGKIISMQNIRLKADLRETPKILGNLDSLKHIFLNLLINAVQSMPEGGTLGIRTYQEDKRIKAEISDTGMGIAEEDLSKIFDPFFTTKDPGKGTGLGLAIVHSQIEGMGGAIRVDSKPGLGSTFTVEFPLREQDDAGQDLTGRR